MNELIATTDMLENFLIKTDSYKVTHWKQYPPGTTKVYSYFEARGCTPKDTKGNDLYKYTVFFGLQYILQRHFAGQQVTHDRIDEAKKFFAEHFGTDVFNEEGWRYIANTYDGYLPLKIKAVKEGTKVPLKNVLFTIENTDPKCFWLTNFAETLLMQVWHTITVATNSSHGRDILLKAHEQTCDEVFVDYSLHDFGARGGSTFETSVVGDMAHLVLFNGTDTMSGIVMANLAYDNDIDSFLINPTPTRLEMLGHSVVATEHSTMTSWGKEHERDCIINLLKQYPTGILSVVGDSYDIFAFARLLSEDEEIKKLILERDGKFVLRPDSGDPVDVNCGINVTVDNKYMKTEADIYQWYKDEGSSLFDIGPDHYQDKHEEICHVAEGYFKVNIEARVGTYEDPNGSDRYVWDGVHSIDIKPVELSDEQKGLLNILWEGFGGTINEKGFKVLNPKVGLIQGDGIDLAMMEQILERMEQIGFAASNMVFGSGGGLIQKFDRDTLKIAIKCSFAVINGEDVNVQKDPKTSVGKKSKKGRLALILKDNQFETLQELSTDDFPGDQLELVFDNGNMIRYQSFNEVREIARSK